MLREAARYLRQLNDDLKAVFASWLVKREVTRVLKVTHAQELASTPRNEWPLAMRRQQQEIQAVANGGMVDIIDRRTWAYPYLPEALHRLNQPILKNTPYNLRRFSETPIPRRAINLIKNTVLALKFKISRIDDNSEETPDQAQRIKILEQSLRRPNNEDSFRDWLEPVLEDLIIGGYGCAEVRITPYFERPFKMWAVDGSTVRRFMDWSESTPDRPKFAQMTGMKGERGIVTFLANELIYIRDNIRTNTPFGLGKLEVAFNTVNAFLGVQDMAGRAGSDQVHKTWLWWEVSLNPANIQTVRRHLTHEAEGQSVISMTSGFKKPEVIDVKAVTPEDLLLDWQEMLIRIIANAFDISPLSLGLERDVNRNTGEVMTYSDFRNAVVPCAVRVQEAITHGLIHNLLGWTDLQLEFIGLDDPDSMTKVMIQARKYMMDSLTSDEVRESDDLPPLPGGWGKLTQMEKMIIMQSAILKARGGMGGGMGMGGMGMGSGMGMGGMSRGMGLGSGMGSSGGGSMGLGMRFSAFDVSQMTPDEVQMYQEFGLLPPTPELGDQMEQQAPGILETISDELKKFFEKAEAEEDEMQVQPAPIVPGQEAEQQKKFKDAEHVESISEQMINRRGIYGPSLDQSVRKNAVRGKYPRNPDGGFNQMPGGHYRPGKGNKKF